MPSPIALFVYNRPSHTRQTVESLRENPEAGESDLYVFSDGPRDAAAVDAVGQVRTYVRSITGFRNVIVQERDVNLGLAESIVNGVTLLCHTHGKAIVVEDDLLASPYFLGFMNGALDCYENAPTVMHVSGSAYPIERSSFGGTYFLRVPLCWGWATWDRAWSGFERDTAVMTQFDKSMIREFDFGGTYGYWRQLELNRSGRIATWFAFWYANLFLQEGLALFPDRPLVRNMGHDGSGVHCASTHCFDVELSPLPIVVRPIPLVESAEAFDAHRDYFRSIAPGLGARLRGRAGSAMRRLGL